MAFFRRRIDTGTPVLNRPFPSRHDWRGYCFNVLEPTSGQATMDVQDANIGVDIGHFLTSAHGDRYLHVVNRSAFTTRPADAVLFDHFGNQLFDDNRFFVICGTDSGLLLHFLMRQSLPARTLYIFVELDPVRLRLMEELNLSALPPQIRVCGPGDWRQTANELDLNRYLHLDRVHPIQSLAALDANLDLYRPLWREVKSQVMLALWDARSQRTFLRQLTRQIQNLPDNQFSSACLRDLCKGQTAIVLGGAPSLDEALPWIRANRDQLVVIAAARICRSLVEGNIKPDMVVAIDPSDGQFSVCKEMYQFADEAIFVAGYHVSPLLLSAWPGRKVYIGPRSPWKTDIAEDALPQWGPTVTNAALGVAIDMGFSQVLLAGVDLCYAQDGTTHASGTDERDTGYSSFSSADQQVRTNNGCVAETKNEFLRAAEQVEKAAALAARHQCQIINLAANAMQLDGVRFSPPEQISLPASQDSACASLYQSIPLPDASELRSYYRRVLKDLDRSLEALRAIRKMAQEALDHSKALFANGDQQPDPKLKSRIDRIEERIERRYKDTANFLKRFGLRHFQYSIRVGDSAQWKREELESFAVDYYGAFVTSAKEVLDLTLPVRSTLVRRLQEEDSGTDIGKLADAWESHEEPGRAQVWRARNPQAFEKLSPELQTRLQALTDAFYAKADQLRSKRRKALRNVNRLQGVHGKAAEHFNQHDRDSLERMLRSLEHHPDREQAIRLGALARGYLLELNEDHRQALAAYQQVGEGEGYEDALMRITHLHLGLGELQQALLSMRELSEVSLFYHPLYAELLRITGDAQGALDIYTAYLAAVPQDLGAMLKMGQLYHQLGIHEATLWVMRHILERDPSNQLAHQIVGEAQQAAAAAPQG